jgi:Ca2+-binding EF-hand superfamily protein
MLAAGAAIAQEGPGEMQFIRMSPILNAVDADQNGTISAAEIAGAVPQLRKLDKNGDGKLTREEAGLQMPGRGGRGPGREGGRGGEAPETPAPPPSADDLTSQFMMFDANKNGQIEKSEMPERMMSMFDRGDTNKDGILTKTEIVALATANQKMNLPPQQGRGGRGPGGFDLAFTALDTNSDGEISSDEINNAPAALKKLDKNGDGQITEDEVRPMMPGRGPGEGRG